jgi:hypothetical protein
MPQLILDEPAAQFARNDLPKFAGHIYLWSAVVHTTGTPGDVEISFIGV